MCCRSMGGLPGFDLLRQKSVIRNNPSDRHFPCPLVLSHNPILHGK